MRVRVKVWLEGDDGRVAVSDWRVALLEAIASYGSLVAAARAMHVPHRTAWQRVRETEERTGLKLVEASSGGSAGGASRLTPEGEALVRRFRALTAGVDERLEGRFAEEFGGRG